MIDPPEASESDGTRNIKRSPAQHRAAVEDARVHPEGRTASVVDAEPINTGAPATPRKRATALKETGHRRLTPAMEKATVKSVVDGSSSRAAAKVFGASLGTLSSLIKISTGVRSQAQGGRGEPAVRVTPALQRPLRDSLQRPTALIERDALEPIEGESAALPTSSILSLLRNPEIACKRPHKEPPGRNFSQSGSVRTERACTFSGPRDAGANSYSPTRVAPTSP